MDMVLYSLFKNKIANTPKDKVDNVNGTEIRFINSEDLSTTEREQDTLYFVLNDYKEGDKINIGGKGVQCVIFNDYYIDYGVLNNNKFFNGYDFNRGYKRVLETTDKGTIVVENTVAEAINHFMIKGLTKESGGQIISGDSFLETVSISEDGNVNDIPPEYYININKYFNALPNGMADTLDMTTGVYTQVLETTTINEDLVWQHVYLYGDYREFKVKTYENNKPSYILSSGLYNNREFMEINEDNAFVVGKYISTEDNGFTIGESIFTVASPTTRDDKNCIYTNNGSLLIRIRYDLVGDRNTYSTKKLQDYLRDNPIVFSVGRLVPKQETILNVANKLPLMAMEGRTNIVFRSQKTHPLLEVELPVYKNPPIQPTSIFGLERNIASEEVCEYETVTLDGNLNWQNSAPLGDYREFKCVGFDEKPVYLTEDGLYNETIFMPFDEDNITILNANSNFTVNSNEEPNGECIFVRNSVLYIHIYANNVSTGGGTTYAKSLKQYLTDNPITLRIKKSSQGVKNL